MDGFRIYRISLYAIKIIILINNFNLIKKFIKN